MRTTVRCKRRGELRCTLCGGEIPLGEEYWACNGSVVCAGCLEGFARGELAAFRVVRGEEERV